MTHLRVAYLLKKFPRLSETFVLQEILGQEARGTRVHVVSRRSADDEPHHEALARLVARIETLPAKYELDPFGSLFTADLDAKEVFRRVGALVHEARGWNHPRFPHLLAEALVLLPRLSSLGIEHVHAHFATDSAVVAMLIQALGGPGYSVTAHAKDIYRDTVDWAMLERIVVRSRFVVTVCEANLAHLRARLSPAAAARVRRLYNGIDLDSFAYVEDGREPVHVLGVGRLIEKKGFDVLVRAVAQLRDRGIAARATLIGDGEELERLSALAGELGLRERVAFLGARTQEEVRAFLRRATVMCLPCQVGLDGNRDALPTVLLEALASGLPVVSTPVTGIPEIVDHGRAGLLVPESDPRATAQALADLLTNASHRLALARTGRARAEELFDAHAAARTLQSWFAEAREHQEVACASPA